MRVIYETDPSNFWTEHEHQCQVIKYRDFVVAHKLAGHGALRWMHSVPNGGQRHAAVAGKLKAEGAMPGVCDLMLDWRMGDKSGLRIEVKKIAKSAKATKEQLDYLEHVRAQGFVGQVCFGYRATWAAICEYLQIQDPLQNR